MKAEDCKSYIKCNASICPLDKDSLENCIWYPDEDICNKIHSPRWIKTQKKIRKKCQNTDTYFTYTMLNRNIIIKKGIEGLDPDKKEGLQLERWLSNHQEIRKYTDEEKKRIGERLKKGREISQLEIGV